MNEPIIPKERIFHEFSLKLMESSMPISLDGELIDVQIHTKEKEGSEYLDFTFIYDPTGRTKNHYEIRVLKANNKDVHIKNLMFHTIYNSCYDRIYGTTKKHTKWYIFIVKAWRTGRIFRPLFLILFFLTNPSPFGHLHLSREKCSLLDKGG